MGTWTPGPGASSGDDTYVADPAVADFALGHGGNDTFNIITPTNNSAFFDQFWGEDGNDVFNVSRGGVNGTMAGNGSLIVGGNDYDTVNYTTSTVGISAAYNFATAINDGLIDIEAVVGTAYNDTIIGFVWMDGGGGNDTLTGIGANETIFGGEGADTLFGAAGNDTLDGGNGDDTVQGGDGDDTLTGGAGFDTLSYANASAAVHVVMSSSPSATDTEGAGWDTLNGFEALTGSAFDDYLALGSDAAASLLHGGDGADTLFANDGVDTLYGDAGNDTFNGLGPEDTAYGGVGNDTYVVSSSGATIVELSGEGRDLIEFVVGSSEPDAAITMAANVDDLSVLGQKQATVTGNDLDNVINANLTHDTLSQLWTDTLRGMGGNDTLHGGDGADSLDGGTGADALYGDDGADTLDGGAGDDLLDGGAGTDTASYQNAGSGVVVDLSVSSAQNTLGAGVDTLLNIESITGSAFADTLTGNSSANILDGRAGADTMAGGAGNDTYIVDNAGDVVSESLNDGYDFVRTALSSHTLSANVEELTFTGSGNFSGTGNSLANTITSSAGNDTLDGGAGNDTLYGGAGNDTYVVDSASDVIWEFASEGTDTVRATVSYTLAAVELENLTFIGSGNFVGTGNYLANTITGGAGDDTLRGNGGGDTLIGGAGSDTAVFAGTRADYQIAQVSSHIYSVTDLRGGAPDGVDIINGIEFAQFSDGTVAEGVFLVAATNGNDILVGSAGDDVISGLAGNDQISGLGGSDILTGGAGEDLVYGGDGDDTLISGADHDVLDGGAGVDTADFSSFGAAIGVYLAVGAGDEVWTRDGANLSSGTWRGIADIANVESVIGTAFDDLLQTNALTTNLSGGGGDDVLNAYARSQTSPLLTLDGGANNAGGDTVTFADFAAAVWVNLNYTGYEGWTRDTTNVATGNWRAIGDITNVENIIGSAYDDELHGGTGANVISYTGGLDVIDGDAGVDTVDFSRFGAAVWAALSYSGYEGWTRDTANVDTGTWRAIADISNVENLTGTSYDDYLRGSSTGNTLVGGAGNDTLEGGAGGDVLNGGQGVDTASYALSGAGVTVNLSAGSASGGDAAGDSFVSIENLIGSSSVDTLTGTTGANLIDGGAGADFLIGLAGDDTYLVTQGDTVTEASGAGVDRILSAATSFTIGDNIEFYQFTGAGSYAVTGGATDNTFSFGPNAGLAHDQRHGRERHDRFLQLWRRGVGEP